MIASLQCCLPFATRLPAPFAVLKPTAPPGMKMPIPPKMTHARMPQSGARAASGRLFAMRDGTGAAGQATVEFALILPVFLMIAAGTIQFGQVFFNYAKLLQATQEGA